ncbi:hypothetical protein, partial [uncultured Devosia sp.]|uniref:hypothetical protein n=1 Tax=uncultured Devosia sp. TaxID=211434 RepID=UPI00260AA43A
VLFALWTIGRKSARSSNRQRFFVCVLSDRSQERPIVQPVEVLFALWTIGRKSARSSNRC